MNICLLNKYLEQNIKAADDIVLMPQVVCFDKTDSTNVQVAKVVKTQKFGRPLLITADEQTAGKGRLNRNFYSPKETGVYFSLFVNGEFELNDVIKFTPLAAVCVGKAIEKFSAQKPLIKWVNDVYINDKKVCGILCESVLNKTCDKASGVIIGIGVNLATKDFPSTIPGAASVFDSVDTMKNSVSPEAFVAEIATQILFEAPYIANNRHMSYYKSHSYLTGKNIEWVYKDVKKTGKCLGIGDNGELIAQSTNGEIFTLIGGEITVRAK